ncbi:hypothetical protein DPX16_23818 [Anabarilius grahami]|uniref:Uncharacterized protein n=1 Tax=Anabarilius grahami TaxID=495550 RepID=A0A3N0Z4Q7_ANAGA|nr:hypothetical protein DPX16_23818 [Anabarilius grahami]
MTSWTPPYSPNSIRTTLIVQHPGAEVVHVAILGGLQEQPLEEGFHPVEDRIHHGGMDGLLNCATGCRVDEAFTTDDLVDSISADTSGLRCGHVQLRIVFITPVSLRPGSLGPAARLVGPRPTTPSHVLITQQTGNHFRDNLKIYPQPADPTLLSLKASCKYRTF